MTKKDFEILAEMFAELEANDYTRLYWKSQEVIDSYLKKANPNYDKSKFWMRVDEHMQAILTDKLADELEERGAFDYIKLATECAG